jgi:uncharacterized membrane protein
LFPNSPYILTEILHLSPRDNIPFWYDTILYLSAAFIGLLPGLVSLRKVEKFLALHLPRFWVKVSVLFCIFLSGYGVYLGRFLRPDKFDIISDSKKLLTVSEHDIFAPLQHLNVWIFVVAFAIFMDVVYVGFKNLPSLMRPNKH